MNRDDRRVVPTPDYSMPLIGWRAWRVKPVAKPVLAPLLHIASPWPGRKAIKAVCHGNRRHPNITVRELTYPPFFHCSCGVYALKTVGHLLRHDFRILSNTLMVYGPVALWGKVIRHSAGYRAQYAYPLALFVDPPELALQRPDRTAVAKRMSARLAKRYGIPVVLMKLDMKADRVVTVDPGAYTWLKTKIAPYELFTGGLLPKRWTKRMIQQFKTAAKRYTGPGARGGILDTLL